MHRLKEGMRGLFLLGLMVGTGWGQDIATVAGTGVAGFSGDSGSAIGAQLNRPNAAWIDGAGNLYISDRNNHRVRKIDAAGVITTVAGTGVAGYSGDTGSATSAQLNYPGALVMDSAGILYIMDYGNHRVRKVDATGIITTAAGTGVAGYSGDGGPATSAQLNLLGPAGIGMDGSGNLYIADRNNCRVRKVDASGVITTVAGTGTCGYSGDGGPATSAKLSNLSALMVDGSGNIYIGDQYTNQRVRKVDTAGIITTLAGTGVQGHTGDGGPATSAQINNPSGLAMDGMGNLYITVQSSHRVRKVDTDGIITTIIGTGAAGYSGDGGPAVSAQLYNPTGLVMDGVGNFYIADMDNQRVRKVAAPVVAVSVPDTTAMYGDVLTVPVRVGDVSGQGIVSAEAFLAYDGDLLTAVSSGISGTLLAAGWSVETNVVPGIGTSIDTIKMAMATDDDELTGAGTLIEVNLQVADIRHPAVSPLTLTHLLFNDGDPEAVSGDGSVTLVGMDGVIVSQPAEIIPRWSVGVSVYDVDEDRDSGALDAFVVQVVNGGQAETLTVTETGIGTGVFSGGIGTAFSLSFTTDDGIVQAKAGDQIVFSYADSLDGAGATVERTDFTDVVGGTDGAIRVSVVSQPGDTVRVRVADADLDESVFVSVENGRTGEVESIVLSQFDVGDSHFYGRFFTDSQAGAVGDSTLEVAKGDVVVVTYADTLTAEGGTAVRMDDDEGVDPFGDADGNGTVQAFDAAQVLWHRLLTYGDNPGNLTGLDSLSANVDTLAPFGIIDGYDASLILRKVVGLVDRFEVQEPVAANHPQPETRTRPKRILEERELALRAGEGYVSIWVDERVGIVSGELQVEGMAGAVSMGEALEDFLVVSRERQDGMQVVFAGATGVSGPGELLRVYTEVGPGTVQLARASFNGGRIGTRAVDAGGGEAQPLAYALYANAPNPFNPETAIRYALPEEAGVRLAVYDALGRQVETLVEARQGAGVRQVAWDGRDQDGRAVGSGVYFYRLEAGGFSAVRRMLLIK